MRRLLRTGVLVAFLAACGNGDSATQPTADPNAAPSLITAVREDGRVVRLDSDTGQEVAALAGGAETGDRAGLALPTGGSQVIFVRPLSGGEVELARVPVTGGDPLSISRGFAPAAHPEDARVAYAFGEDPRRADQIIIRNLDDANASSNFELEPREGYDPTTGVTDVAWAAGGSRLAYLLATEDAGSGFLLDPAAPSSLHDGQRVGPSNAEASWVALSARGVAGAIAVVEGCCRPDYAQSWRVIESRAAGGEDELFALPGPAQGIDFDASGRHGLIVRDKTLFRWSGGEVVRVASGILAAVW